MHCTSTITGTRRRLNLRKRSDSIPILRLRISTRGEALRQSGDLPGALDELGIAKKLRPNCVDFRIELGLALLQQNNVEDSAATLRGVVEDAPDNASAHYALARALKRGGKAAEAEEQFKEADRLRQGERERDDATLYTLNGIHSLQSGKISEAVESVRQAVARKPDYAEAYYYLGHRPSEIRRWQRVGNARFVRRSREGLKALRYITTLE